MAKVKYIGRNGQANIRDYFVCELSCLKLTIYSFLFALTSL